MKIVRSKSVEYLQVALNEFKLVRALDHPHIIKMHEMFFNPRREIVHVVMDLVSGMTLKKFMKA